MSTLTAPPRPAGGTTLRRAHLPGWSLVAAGVGAVAVTAVLAAVTSLSGWVRFVAVAGVLYLVAQTVASALVEGSRATRNRLATSLVLTCFLIALAPLVSVVYQVVSQGASRFDLAFFTQDQSTAIASDPGGGAFHAIVATAEQVGLASVVAIPIGLLVAVYLVEYGRGRFAKTVSYLVDVMTGLPSIVAGLFILAFYIIYLRDGQGFSGAAGAAALAILELPIVSRSAEEMLRLVPDGLREASYALGVPRWRTVLKVVLPTALPGIITGVMLAVARISGETAPILLLTFGSDFTNYNPFQGAQSSLPLFIYQQAKLPQNNAVARAWTGALVLVLFVMLLNLLARGVAAYFSRNRSA